MDHYFLGTHIQIMRDSWGDVRFVLNGAVRGVGKYGSSAHALEDAELTVLMYMNKYKEEKARWSSMLEEDEEELPFPMDEFRKRMERLLDLERVTE